MGLFNKQEGVISGSMAARMRPTEPKPVQEIAMVIEYFDQQKRFHSPIIWKNYKN